MYCKLGVEAHTMIWSNILFTSLNFKQLQITYSFRENVWVIICDQVTTLCLQLDGSDEIQNVGLNHKFIENCIGQFGMSRFSTVHCTTQLGNLDVGVEFKIRSSVFIWSPFNVIRLKYVALDMKFWEDWHISSLSSSQ